MGAGIMHVKLNILHRIFNNSIQIRNLFPYIFGNRKFYSELNLNRIKVWIESNSRSWIDGYLNVVNCNFINISFKTKYVKTTNRSHSQTTAVFTVPKTNKVTQS